MIELRQLCPTCHKLYGAPVMEPHASEFNDGTGFLRWLTLCCNAWLGDEPVSYDPTNPEVLFRRRRGGMSPTANVTGLPS